MITRIKSKKLELPVIFLIENEADFKELPKGLPYIVGKQSDLAFITLFLEFQILYKSCMNIGLPIKWMDCLKRAGYNVSSMKNYTLNSGGEFWDGGGVSKNVLSVDDFITDQYFVNFDKLSELYILPKWLDDLKLSVETNIIDEVVFNPLAFNKQIGMSVGAPELAHNSRNLLILDVSGSIPKSISMSISALAKLMARKFYADIIFTASKTVFVDYDNMETTDLIDISNSIGRGNEGQDFHNLLKEEKKYNTIICFGDDDHPVAFGANAKDVCNVTCETLYSLHTRGTKDLAGYCRCFKPKVTNKVADWVTTISQ